MTVRFNTNTSEVAGKGLFDPVCRLSNFMVEQYKLGSMVMYLKTSAQGGDAICQKLR